MSKRAPMVSLATLVLVGTALAGTGLERGKWRQPGSSAEALRRAAEERDRMPAADLSKKRVGPGDVPQPSARWEFVGPRNVRSGDTCRDSNNNVVGCVVSGRVAAAAYAPSNASIRYLATAMGGVWKSTNSGANWAPQTDTLPFLQTSSVAVHPTNPNVVYVGTGDFNRAYTGFSLGVIKSTDGGATWRQLPFPATFWAVSALTIDPDNPQIIMATTGRGVDIQGYVWRSTDGGETWNSPIVGARPWSDVEIGAPNSSGVRRYYVVGHGSAANEIWRSTNRGATWQRTAPLPWSPAGEVAMEVAASRVNPQTVYVVAAGYTGDQARVYVSTNAGGSWSLLGGGGLSLGTQGGSDLVLTCAGNSSTGDIVYVGGQSHLFAFRAQTSPTWVFIEAGHLDQHGMAVHPNGTEVMIGNDGGIFRRTFSTSFPGCGTANPQACWRGPYSQNATLHTFKNCVLATHPYDPTRMAVGTQDNGTVVALGNLNSWTRPLGGDGRGVAYAPIAPYLFYAAPNWFVPGHDVVRSFDGGSTFDSIRPPWRSDNVINIPTGTVYLDPNGFVDNVEGWTSVYAMSNYLWRRGVSGWERVGDNNPGDHTIAWTQAVAISVPDGNADLVYTGSGDGRVTMVEGATQAFPVFTNLSAELPGSDEGPVAVVSHDPANHRDLLVGRGGRYARGSLWRCIDTEGGCTRGEWINVGGGLPGAAVNDVARDPDDPSNTWYVATNVGVFYTTDAGHSWTNATAPLGLPNVIATSIVATPFTRFLSVGTYGRGVWRIPF